MQNPTARRLHRSCEWRTPLLLAIGIRLQCTMSIVGLRAEPLFSFVGKYSGKTPLMFLAKRTPLTLVLLLNNAPCATLPDQSARARAQHLSGTSVWERATSAIGAAYAFSWPHNTGILV